MSDALVSTESALGGAEYGTGRAGPNGAEGPNDDPDKAESFTEEALLVSPNRDGDRGAPKGF